jgi:hypothetical protein
VALAARRVYRASWLAAISKAPLLLLGYIVSLIVLLMLTRKIIELL